MRIFHVRAMTVAMVWTIICAMGVALTALGPRAHAQSPGAFGQGGPPHIAARLVTETPAPAPGGAFTLAFDMRPASGWHGYWENPGDAGLGMTVHWTAPQGVTLGPLRYPVPATLIVSSLMNHVYEGPYAVLVSGRVPAGMTPGERLPIRVRADWLACTREVCVPEGADLSVEMVVGSGAVDGALQARFDGYRAHLPRPLGAEGRYQLAGGRFRLAVPLPAAVTVSDPHFFARTDHALRFAAPQNISRNGDMLIVETDADGAAKSGGAVEGVLSTGDHLGLMLTARPGLVPPAGEPLERAGASAKATGLNAIVAALGGALLGGLLLNIMPCVFPILSLKALKLARAGGDGGAAKREAVAYALGVVATCVVLGGVLLALRAGGATVGWAFQLQDPRVILLLLILVTAIALNLAGLFALPAIGMGEGLAARSGTGGAFWTGALVAFVATPCTGPFMGAALGAALVLPLVAALAVFAGLGIGLALPFVLVAFVPAIRRRLPRPGAWMERLQRILSIPMFLTALGLAWLLGQQRGPAGIGIGIGAALLAAAALWWLGQRQRHGRAGGVPATAAVALALGLGVVLLPTRPTDANAAVTKSGAIPFDAAKLAALRKAGRPVFLYFTADWCITCKANEAAAIDRAEVARAFAQDGVVVMVGDWTNGDPAIGRFLESQGRSGVPLYLWYAPGQPVKVLPQILTPATLTGLL
jgi:thiol:disulfide interchange protein/DsbC/DsbD-like thiol-disulfide interchange protein